MAAIVPSSAPQQDKDQSVDIIVANGITDGFALLGVRGYYLNTMGEKSKNDRGIYDDAIVLITPTAYVTFNANCDPSIFRPKIASLKPGVWQYKLGTHGLSKPIERQYQALVQAASVTVLRDGGREETGFFGINIHRGGLNSTSSEGCQTIYPKQWDSFIALVAAELKRHGRSRVPYVLVETSA